MKKAIDRVQNYCYHISGKVITLCKTGYSDKDIRIFRNGELFPMYNTFYILRKNNFAFLNFLIEI